MIRAAVPLADGVEEMEAVIIIDVLRRAGWDVTAAGLTDLSITASRGVHLHADILWSDRVCEGLDILVIPGGAGGVAALRADGRVAQAAARLHRQGGWVAAVCAGPLVLMDAGLLHDTPFTCHPGVTEDLHANLVRRNDPVVYHNHILTSQGPGTCFAFALELVRQVEGSEKIETLSRALRL